MDFLALRQNLFVFFFSFCGKMIADKRKYQSAIVGKNRQLSPLHRLQIKTRRYIFSRVIASLSFHRFQKTYSANHIFFRFLLTFLEKFLEKLNIVLVSSLRVIVGFKCGPFRALKYCSIIGMMSRGTTLKPFKD